MEKPHQGHSYSHSLMGKMIVRLLVYFVEGYSTACVFYGRVFDCLCVSWKGIRLLVYFMEGYSTVCVSWKGIRLHVCFMEGYSTVCVSWKGIRLLVGFMEGYSTVFVFHERVFSDLQSPSKTVFLVAYWFVVVVVVSAAIPALSLF